MPTQDDPNWGAFVLSRWEQWPYGFIVKLQLGTRHLRDRERWDAEVLENPASERPPRQLGESAYISMNPRYRNMRYLRVEFSPHSAGERGKARLRSFLELILGTHYEPGIRGAKVTRIDVGFDVAREQLRNLRVEFIRKQTWRGSRLFRGADGELESVYLPPGGTSFLVVYDKTRETNQRQREARIDGHRYTPLASSRVRFEYRWSQQNFSWRDVTQLRNWFARFDVREFRHAHPSLDADLERLFFDANAIRGKRQLLNSIRGNTSRDRATKRLRLRYSYAYQRVPLWWNPDEFWGELPAAIAEIGLYPIDGSSIRRDPVARLLRQAAQERT